MLQLAKGPRSRVVAHHRPLQDVAQVLGHLRLTRRDAQPHRAVLLRLAVALRSGALDGLLEVADALLVVAGLAGQHPELHESRPLISRLLQRATKLDVALDQHSHFIGIVLVHACAETQAPDREALPLQAVELQSVPQGVLVVHHCGLLLSQLRIRQPDVQVRNELPNTVGAFAVLVVECDGFSQVLGLDCHDELAVLVFDGCGPGRAAERGADSAAEGRGGGGGGLAGRGAAAAHELVVHADAVVGQGSALSVVACFADTKELVVGLDRLLVLD
mmetsp:Transcript_115175/g.366006  ORF Transcript_115175/g.366006 Transcript_115175/m.366006 type:complete len:275 (+) Transcript_115175:27-851(+)